MCCSASVGVEDEKVAARGMLSLDSQLLNSNERYISPSLFYSQYMIWVCWEKPSFLLPLYNFFNIFRE